MTLGNPAPIGRFRYTYELIDRHGDNRVLHSFVTQPGLRPKKGMHVKIGRNTYVITATRPANNPDNQIVTYLLDQYNPHAPYKLGIVDNIDKGSSVRTRR